MNKHKNKRLFAIRDTSYKLVVDPTSGQPLYFPDKPSAREYRAKIAPDHYTYFVTYGPDHKKYYK